MNQNSQTILSYFLTTSSHKLQAYANGIRRISDLEPEDIEGFKLQYAQYMASKHGYILMIKAAFKNLDIHDSISNFIS